MSIHVPVLCDEVLHWLNPQPGETICDGTLGGGGHSRLILEKIKPEGRLFGFDRDPLAVEATSQTIDDPAFIGNAGNYSDMPEWMQEYGVDGVDGILLDLGLSSDQLEDESRGFSFNVGGPLDLRFDQTKGEPAWRLVNRLGPKHLADLIYQFGEERHSRRVARKICALREKEPIKTAEQLAEIVRRCVPRSRNHSIDPATRTFQALRIAVNEELKWLQVALRRLPDILNPGGRIAIISFHSLEDRMVKQAFNENQFLDVLTKKPVTATEEEIDSNPRSRSAKLRVAKLRS